MPKPESWDEFYDRMYCVGFNRVAEVIRAALKVEGNGEGGTLPEGIEYAFKYWESVGNAQHVIDFAEKYGMPEQEAGDYLEYLGHFALELALQAERVTFKKNRIKAALACTAYSVGEQRAYYYIAYGEHLSGGISPLPWTVRRMGK